MGQIYLFKVNNGKIRTSPTHFFHRTPLVTASVKAGVTGWMTVVIQEHWIQSYKPHRKFILKSIFEINSFEIIMIP